MCYDSDDGASVWKERTIRARRHHRCNDCHREIPVGRHHVRILSLYDGHWETMRVHSECAALSEFVRTKICEAEGEHGFIQIGGLGEEISILDGEYGGQPLNERDRADCEAMGFRVEDDDDGHVSGFGFYGDVCSWLWDCIKAEYRAPGERGAA
jgi:hypothetical protein